MNGYRYDLREETERTLRRNRRWRAAILLSLFGGSTTVFVLFIWVIVRVTLHYT